MVASVAIDAVGLNRFQPVPLASVFLKENQTAHWSRFSLQKHSDWMAIVVMLDES